MYKLVLSFLLPPGIFITALLVLSFTGTSSGGKKRNKALLILGIALYLLSIEPVKDTFVLPLENRYSVLTGDQLSKADCIVMLGGGIMENAPVSFGGSGIPSYPALSRINEVLRIYHKKPMKILLTGGSIYGEKKTEAVVDNDYLVSLGIRPKDIAYENSSKTTYENAQNIRQKLKTYGFSNPVLVTSAIHMPRGVMSFRKMGIHVIPAPCDYLTSRSGYTVASFFPSASCMNNIRQAIWEYLGYFYYLTK